MVKHDLVQNPYHTEKISYSRVIKLVFNKSFHFRIRDMFRSKCIKKQEFNMSLLSKIRHKYKKYCPRPFIRLYMNPVYIQTPSVKFPERYSFIPNNKILNIIFKNTSKKGP